MVDAVNTFYRSDKDVSLTAQLNPAISYLRSTVNGQVSLLALGYIDPHPLGPINVWYSSAGEVLRLQNGHVVGLVGTPIEWQRAELSTMPVWPAKASAAVNYFRVKDTMPGYKFGVVDQLQLIPIEAPRKSNYIAPGNPANTHNLQWFEVREASNQFPPAKYAVATINGAQTAVYGEQCFSKAFCITWQSWPNQPAAR